jgi:hypothetical protein
MRVCVCVLSFIFSCKKRESKHCLLARSCAFAASRSLSTHY